MAEKSTATLNGRSEDGHRGKCFCPIGSGWTHVCEDRKQAMAIQGDPLFQPFQGHTTG